VNAPDPPRSARDELREQLLQAARRDDALRTASLPSRRRRSRRSLAIVVALVFGGVAAAGAAELISTGDPLPDSTFPGTEYRPGKPGAPVLDAKAKDPKGGQGWGVGTYTSKNGEECAIAGRVRGLALGDVRNGTFREFAPGSTGACGDLKTKPIFIDYRQLDGVTIVYGRTSATDRLVVAHNDGKDIPATPGRRGAFLWVFEGKLLPSDVPVALGEKRRR
jgi:hypothetical protein